MVVFILKSVVNRLATYFKVSDKEMQNLWAEFSMFLFVHAALYLPIPFFLLWFFEYLWALQVVYAIFMLFDSSPEHGGRPVEIVKRWSLWDDAAKYCPFSLIKEAELDPKRKYILGYHPHGALALGAFFNFSTYATNCDLVFPGLVFRVMAIDQLMSIPVFREFALSLGVCSISKKSIKNVLDMGPGHSCVIVAGGIKESTLTEYNSLKLVLSNRNGFIRQAIENGADLVPVFGFNENRSYIKVDNSEGTLLHRIQMQTKKFTRVVVLIFYGRGFYSRLGFLPLKVPIVTVVGAPIRVEQDPNPTEETVDKYHQQYIEALTDLYNRNKDKYWNGKNPPELEIV